MADRRFALKLLFMLGGLLVWAAHFTVIYGINAVACARTFAGMSMLGVGIVPFGIGIATVLALAATLALLFAALGRRGPAQDSRSGEPSEQFLRYGTILLAVLSLVAIAWDGLPALMIPPCA